MSCHVVRCHVSSRALSRGFQVFQSEEMALDDRHHAFLQSLMSRGPQPDALAKKMYRELFQVRNDQLEESFYQFLGAYNKKLDFFQLEIKWSNNQYDGTKHFGVVNKLADEQAKLGTRYTYGQIAYFKALVEAIVQDPSGELSSIDALNIIVEHNNNKDQEAGASSQATQVASTANLTMAQREKALDEMVSDQWLARSSGGGITLGVRAFLELRSVFSNLEVPFCDVCNEAGVKALKCTNTNCPARMHVYCARAKFSRPEAPRACPTCGTEWDCEGLDLPRADDKPVLGSSSRKKASKRRRS